MRRQDTALLRRLAVLHRTADPADRTPRREQLSHAGVDNRHTGAGFAPRAERHVVAMPRGAGRPVVPAGQLGKLSQHLEKELAPRQLPYKCLPARVLGDTARSLTAGSEVTIALAAGGTGEGIIGFEGSAPGGTRRTTTRLLDGEFPKVRSLFPNEHQTHQKVDTSEYE